MVVIFEFWMRSVSTGRLHLLEMLTFTSNIVKDAQIEILSITHFVAEDDLALEVEDGDMSPVKRDARLVPSRAPSVEDCRHDDWMDESSGRVQDCPSTLKRGEKPLRIG